MTATFLAGGIGGAVVRAPVWATTAYLGFAAGGQQGINDAVNHGATPEQAALSYWANGAAGTSEALPVMQIFNRLDKYSGGIFGKNMANKLLVLKLQIK